MFIDVILSSHFDTNNVNVADQQYYNCIKSVQDDDGAARYIWLELGFVGALGYKVPSPGYVFGYDGQSPDPFLNFINTARSEKLVNHFKKWQDEQK